MREEFRSRHVTQLGPFVRVADNNKYSVWLQPPGQTLRYAISRPETSAADIQTAEWRPYIIFWPAAFLLTLPQLMSPGLKRAREPYRLRNAFTGLGLGLLAFGIYSYAIGAVKQDVFDDVDEEAKALARTGTLSRSASEPKPPTIPLSQDQEQRIMERAFSAALDAGGSSTAEGPIAPSSTAPPKQKPGQGAGLSHKLKHWLGME